MKENLNKDYFKYLLYKTRLNLTRYQISSHDAELIRKIFEKFSHTENLPAELFIFYNIKEFRNLSKYFIFIIKKIEDNVINFDNLQQNLHSDSEYLEKEILNYLSNPARKKFSEVKFQEEKKEIKGFQTIDEPASDKSAEDLFSEKESMEELKELEEEESEFTKNYLELIQAAEKDEEIVYELPGLHTEKDDNESDSPFDLPDLKDIDEIDKERTDLYEQAEPTQQTDQTGPDEQTVPTENSKLEESHTEEKVTVTSREEIDFTGEDEIDIKEEAPEITFASGEESNPEDTDEGKDRITLSDEIQEELNLFKESEEPDTAEDDFPEEDKSEEQPANALFVEYEKDIRENNILLESGFRRMIELLKDKNENDDERTNIITGIIQKASHLENISRDMSLEIISNIYQTIKLSFEKISDSKYDLSESTLNLFIKGLSLVLSLIKGDDYYGYKDILKSIENIRNSLLEEKQKRETYLKRLQEKMEAESSLDKRFTNDSQKEKIILLKQMIKDTENNFKSLDRISGEYQIYEALRSLSGSLNNLKDIVKISKELHMKKLVQLSEAGYIFIKFLQNYRINPVTIETKEIFGYIIYNLKSLLMGKQVEDTDLFISYLNDPVKIFSKTGKKKH